MISLSPASTQLSHCLSPAGCSAFPRALPLGLQSLPARPSASWRLPSVVIAGTALSADCVTSKPTHASQLVCFADVHQGGQADHHPAALLQHAGGFLGSGLGLHLHGGGCAEPAPGAGQGQLPSPLPAACFLPLPLHVGLLARVLLAMGMSCKPLGSTWLRPENSPSPVE